MNYLDRLKTEKDGVFVPRRRVVADIIPRSRIGRKSPVPVVPSPKKMPAPVRVPPPVEEPAPSLREEPQRRASTLPEVPVTTWVPGSVRRSRFRRRVALFGGGTLALAIFFVPTVFFPRFTITLYPKVEAIPVPTTEFMGDPDITEPDVKTQSVPVLVVSVEREVSGEYPATGKKFVRERARGEVKIFNAFSSAPQQLVAGTRLQDPSGHVFRLESEITVPGASVENGKIVPTSIQSRVIADVAGAESNIGPADFRIPGFRGSPKYDGFYAKSEAPLTGGFEGEALIVLTDDLRKASEDVTKRAIDEVRTELERKIPGGEDFIMLDGAQDAEIVEVMTPDPGERFDHFPATAIAKGRLLVFRRSHISSILAQNLIPDGERAITKIMDQQPGLTFSAARFTPSDETRFRFDAQGELEYYREPDLETLTTILQTSTPRKAEAYLRGREEIGAFRLKRFPPWLWFIPERADGLRLTTAPPQ